jgi:hypothetical protein
MKADMATGFRSGLALAHVSAETFCSAASKIRVRQLSPTRILRIEQSPSNHKQIGQCGRDLESMQVLRQTSVAHLLEAEDPLDDANNMLDFGTHSRLGAVGRFDRLVNALAPAISLVGEVPSLNNS